MVFLLLAGLMDAGDAGSEAIHAQEAPRAEFEYTLEGPYTHRNLGLFLVHGADRSLGKKFLTLQEALKGQQAVVHETENVNELAVENVNEESFVYIQAGDVVTGGKQDRVLALDLLLGPRSGKVSIASFCVERGRWSRRGTEYDSIFGGSDHQLPTKGLKLAMKSQQSQSQVWSEVAMSNNAISLNAASVLTESTRELRDSDVESGKASTFSATAGEYSVPPALAGTGSESSARQQPEEDGGSAISNGGGAVMASDDSQAMTGAVTVIGITDHVGTVTGLAIVSVDGIAETVSGGLTIAADSSLNATLDNPEVQKAAQEYLEPLLAITEGKEDVIGFVYAVNGKISSAEVYGSSDLFKRMWPKLLQASAMEAIADFRKEQAFEEVTSDAVQAFLVKAKAGKLSEKEIQKGVKLLTCETDEILFSETREVSDGDAWIHRSYLSQSSRE